MPGKRSGATVSVYSGVGNESAFGRDGEAACPAAGHREHDESESYFDWAAARRRCCSDSAAATRFTACVDFVRGVAGGGRARRTPLAGGGASSEADFAARRGAAGISGS